MHQFLPEYKHIHMIGIGGSGMFPLAQILHTDGHILTGSDNNEGDTLNKVREMGVTVFLGHREENIQGADLIVYSAAINKANPELVAAAKEGIPTMERATLLGLVTRRYSKTYGVCGTHGKTTTSSLLTQIFLMADKDPAAVIGGKLPYMNNGSGRMGQEELMVCESCEYVDTFLQLSPDVAVILNIDDDHMEYFKTMENLKASFRKFASMAKKGIIHNGDDPETKDAISGLEGPFVSFGLSSENDFYPENITVSNGKYHFDVMKRGEKCFEASLRIPGKHNILNALAAVAAADYEGVSFAVTEQAISAFGGAHRRFEQLGVLHTGAVVADDYAHHPTELAATLSAAKSLDHGRLIAVFQPFTFSRTALLMEDFAKALQIADLVVLSPIMGSREINTYGVTSEQLAEKVPQSIVLPNFDAIADWLAENTKENDLVLTLGCGDIYKAANLALEKYGRFLA